MLTLSFMLSAETDTQTLVFVHLHVSKDQVLDSFKKRGGLQRE